GPIEAQDADEAELGDLYWQLELVENRISGGIVKRTGEINDATYCRNQHTPLQKNWLHASKGEMTSESQCDDAFTIYAVEPQLVNIFNYVAGYVPLIQRFIFDHKTGSSKLEPIITQPMMKALLELRDFHSVRHDNK
uniref:Phosphorylase b kinase regulatory subunit n=1 Tax=Macrostomum lignano TaxID=282301 RepID=A0A1I8FKL6_9PLAT